VIAQQGTNGPTSTVVSTQILVVGGSVTKTPSGSGTSNGAGTPAAGATNNSAAGTPSVSKSQPGTGSKHPPTSSVESGPILQVMLLPAMVRPRGSEHIAISYAADALVYVSVAFPGAYPTSLFAETDAHGHVKLSVTVPPTVKLRNGRATAGVLVRAISGPWQRVARASPSAKPGAVEQIAVKYAPHTYMRANVNFPGQPSITLWSVTDDHGRIAFAVPVPRNVTVQHGRVVTEIAVWALRDKWHAQVTPNLSISDMLVTIVAGNITNCIQRQTVRVSYVPSVPLQLLLLFPHHFQLPLTARTDEQGNASAQVDVRYAKTTNPVSIVAQASDTRPGVHRMEQASLSVTIPGRCART
jgi:hypothetical protein